MAIFTHALAVAIGVILSPIIQKLIERLYKSADK